MTVKSTVTAIAAAAAIVAGVAGSAHARIDTIDCAVDRNPAERIICGSQHLQILDAKIVEVYAELMQGISLSHVAKRHLRESQYNFLRRRDACGANYDCLEEVMSIRASRINYYR